MASINNWTQLLELASNRSDGVFPKLVLKINQFLRLHQKSNPNFDLDIVKKNHLDVFESFKLIYEQLLIEDDVIDISVEIPSINNKTSINFNIMCVGKWIKLHGGGSTRIFFFDDEKTTLSDRAIADFLNKISLVKSGYSYFSREPLIYYKFKNLPSQDVVDYMLEAGVVAISLQDKTEPFDYPKEFNNNILFDQSMLLTICSNLSYGLSKSFYADYPDEKAEVMVNNRIDLENYIFGKKLLVNASVHEQTKIKLNSSGGPNERERFEIFSKKLTIVPDESNPRFFYLKNGELISASVGEKHCATLITGNHRFKNKLDTYYPEIMYKIFHGAQLAELKYD